MLNDTKKMILFLIGGIILAVCSFLSYYLIKPINWYIIFACCLIDFLYMFWNSNLLFSYSDKRILKACLLSIGYIFVFNIIPIGFLLINGMISRIIEIWKDVLLYSFFTGPCLIIIIIIIFLFLFLYGYANDYKRR